MKAFDKLKTLNGVLDFNVQIFDGDINIYAMATDFHHSDVASVGGYTNLDDAVHDLLAELQNKGYNIDDSMLDPIEEPQWDYEYNVREPKGVFEVGTWIPIMQDRIKKPENIEKYIQMGVLRKFNR